MDRQRLAHALEDLARDVDLAVFDLEQGVRGAEDARLREEREGLRRRLERVRERLVDLAERTLSG